MESGRTLFERFGGIRPMAEALNEKPSTVQGWKNTGRIPSIKQPDVLRRATDLGLDIGTDDVVFPLTARPDRAALAPSGEAVAFDPSAVLNGDLA